MFLHLSADMPHIGTPMQDIIIISINTVHNKKKIVIRIKKAMFAASNVTIWCPYVMTVSKKLTIQERLLKRTENSSDYLLLGSAEDQLI